MCIWLLGDLAIYSPLNMERDFYYAAILTATKLSATPKDATALTAFATNAFTLFAFIHWVFEEANPPLLETTYFHTPVETFTSPKAIWEFRSLNS